MNDEEEKREERREREEIFSARNPFICVDTAKTVIPPVELNWPRRNDICIRQ